MCIEKIKCTHTPDKFSWFLVISLEDPSTSNSSKDQLDNTGAVGNITTYSYLFLKLGKDM